MWRGNPFERKKRAPVRVPVHWFGLWPRRDLRFWGCVALRVRSERVRSMDRARVMKICSEVERDLAAAKHGDAR